MALTLLLWIIVFVVALAVLLKSSDYFTDAAEKIGIRLGLPQFIIGVTIVAVGTSLPELISSIIAVTKDASEIVIGNVVGSNIANILLILGITAIYARKVETAYDLLRIDLPILFASALFVFITCYDGNFSFLEGIIGIAALATYFIYAALQHSDSKVSRTEVAEEKKELKRQGLRIQFLILAVSGLFIFLGAKYVVDSVVNISDILNIAKEVIAITAVAVGTSLPELIVSISAARKGNAGMAFGNVLGSNIFNSFAVLGIPSLIGIVAVPQSVIMFSIPVMLGITVLYIFMVQDRQLTIWEGIILVLAYILYIGKIFGIV